VDMEALVRDALADELAPAIAGRVLAIDVGSLPGTHGDAAMLQRVWTNLLDNAIKFTAPKPEARIEIGATVSGDETVYCVRDNGIGFDMHYVDKLFGVFQRLHGTEIPGTGIGLAIVKRIVTRHGGRVWAEGRVGEGASFYFSLPTPGDRHE
jgi:light-regulated signal transduction histidine kinase (bacteriophytochrome)